MGIRLTRGRAFDRFDGRENGPKVAIVNESVVKRYFGAVDPIGQRVKMPMAGDLHIVGVVADIKHDGLQGNAQAEVFVPYFQFPLTEMQIVIASTEGADAIVQGVKRELAALDPALPIVKVSKIEDLVSAIHRPTTVQHDAPPVACAVRRTVGCGRCLRRCDLLRRSANR